MTLEQFLFTMWYTGRKFIVKKGDTEKEIASDGDLTEDMRNAGIKRYREDIIRDSIVIEIE